MYLIYIKDHKEEEIYHKLMLLDIKVPLKIKQLMLLKIIKKLIQNKFNYQKMYLKLINITIMFMF